MALADQLRVGQQIRVLGRHIHQHGGRQQCHRRQAVGERTRQRQADEHQRHGRDQAGPPARGGPGEGLGRDQEAGARQGTGAERQQHQQQNPAEGCVAGHCPRQQHGRQQVAGGDRSLETQVFLRAERQRRRQVEQAAQVAGREHRAFRHQLGEQPQRHQDQPGLAERPRHDAAATPAVNAAVVGEQPRAPPGAEGGTDQAAEGVESDVEIGGHPRRQEVLQGLETQAEGEAAHHRHQHAGAQVQAPRQRRHHQEAERHKTEHIEHHVVDPVVAGPRRGDEIERMQAALVPAGERVQTRVDHQQGIGGGEVTRKLGGGAEHGGMRRGSVVGLPILGRVADRRGKRPCVQRCRPPAARPQPGRSPTRGSAGRSADRCGTVNRRCWNCVRGRGRSWRRRRRVTT